MPDKLVTVAETAPFVRQAEKIWSDTEREEFVGYIAANPRAGDVIPETGGIRKVRWGRRGSGKRGGARVIYFYTDPNLPLYLPMVYAKARKEDLSSEEKRAARTFASALTANARAR
jgi:hypothetical protein